jgi:hypothetical protein
VGEAGRLEARVPRAATGAGESVRRRLAAFGAVRQARSHGDRKPAGDRAASSPAASAVTAGPVGRLRTALGGKTRPADGPRTADPYEVLRVDRRADVQLVTAAFRDLLKRALAGGDATAAASLERAYARIRASTPSTPDREHRPRVR